MGVGVQYLLLSVVSELVVGQASGWQKAARGLWTHLAGAATSHCTLPASCRSPWGGIFRGPGGEPESCVRLDGVVA